MTPDTDTTPAPDADAAPTLEQRLEALEDAVIALAEAAANRATTSEFGEYDAAIAKAGKKIDRDIRKTIARGEVRKLKTPADN